MNKPSLIATLALSIASCGCGTMASITNSSGSVPPKPFGGVAHDLDEVAAGNILGIVDIPGSFVGDVVTLPDVLIENAHHKRASVAEAGEFEDSARKTGARTRADD